MDPRKRVIFLEDVFRDFPLPVFSAVPHLAVTGIAIDSRRVRPGELFVAMRGGTTDGHRYISSAIQKGAAVVVGDQPLSLTEVPYIQVSDTRRALTALAAGFYGFPARELVIIGVTGTDGKTTTTNLIFEILKSAGIRAGMISTVNAVIGETMLDTGFHVTTPDAHDVQRYLAQMVAAGLTHAVLETTSHGLAQHRVDACEFDIGVITNITHEHLNEHGTYEAYQEAKGRLFILLGETRQKKLGVQRTGVLNRDDASYHYLASIIRAPAVTYGLHEDADIRGNVIQQTPAGMQLTVTVRDLQMRIETRLVGNFNVSNLLAAIAATVSVLGVPPEAARAGIAGLKGVPGRMERVDLGQDFTAIVDFAHTPNALHCALQTARQLAGGRRRVIAVFGSAGLRDREKRRLMPDVSARLADFTVLTAEDPRVESLADILGVMAEQMTAQGGREGATFWRIPDRGEAIRAALRLARPGDVVIACGKGHEQSMCFGDTEYAWDDRQAMRAALAELLAIPGPEMPYLPTQEGKKQ
jgi:UDP-N-acetylmuramoyl-L-alanyl-D-glutamate--2,6-diaminopimelate ligase